MKRGTRFRTTLLPFNPSPRYIVPGIVEKSVRFRRTFHRMRRAGCPACTKITDRQIGKRRSVNITILRSRHNPKIVRIDDAEIVGDGIAKLGPVAGNFVAQESERRVGELDAGRIGFVVGDVSVHEAPQPLDRIEVRAIEGNEMQLDPAIRPGEPVLHQLGVMIARIVEKDVDQRQHRIERFDRFQERDSRSGVDGFDIDHPGLPGLEVDCAVDIDALTPARVLDRKPLLLLRRAADWPRRMGRMDRVYEQHGLVVAQGIQEFIGALDEVPLLRHVELAGNDIRLVIDEPQPMQ